MNSPESQFIYRNDWDLPIQPSHQVLEIAITDQQRDRLDDQGRRRYDFSRPLTMPQEYFDEITSIIDENFSDDGAATPHGDFLFCRALNDYRAGIDFFATKALLERVAERQSPDQTPGTQSNLSENNLQYTLFPKTQRNDFVQ